LEVIEMKKRVLLAGLLHETHTFLRHPTVLSDFKVRRGEEMLAAEGDASPLDGMLEVGREAQWDLIPVIDMRAAPTGTIADEVIEHFWIAFEAAALRELPRGVDGICLNLHGAMVSQTMLDVEGELLRRMRGIPGLETVPICGVLDLHGNITPAMARYGTGLISYRINPHTDARAAAMDGARLLDRLMRTGERPVTVVEQPAIVWPPTGTGTETEPMRTLETYAREIEAAYPDILAVNVFGGFSFSDLPEAGVSFTAVTLGDPEEARNQLKRLSTYAVEHQELGNMLGASLDAVMKQLALHDRGPVILIESADNIGGGAPGDLTPVLRALVEHQVRNSAVVIVDPEAVHRLADIALGEQVQLSLGGWSGELGADPIVLEVEVISRSDGQFTLEDLNSHLAAFDGKHIDMGPCTVVRAGGVLILLTSKKTAPFDLGQLRSQGINPEQLSVIGVKAAVGHRRAYDPIAVASYLLDTPGPCANDLRSLPFQHIRRPIFPLDPA
jgi:microcystin degradation protein MlrC